MLIKFESTATSAPFVMLEDDAKPLLSGMAQAGKLEGAVSGSQLLAALTHLEQMLAKANLKASEKKSTCTDTEDDEDETEAEAPVNAEARAAPLLNMLRKAKAEDGSVMWKPE